MNTPVIPAKKVPHGWRRGEWLLYHHGDNGNHCLEPESFRRPRHSYSVDDIGLIWFMNKTDCDDWLRWWHAVETSRESWCGDCVNLNGVDWVCTKPADHREHDRHPQSQSKTNRDEAASPVTSYTCACCGEGFVTSDARDVHEYQCQRNPEQKL